MGTPLLDPLGDAFELLRSSGAGDGIWRAELFELESVADDAVVLTAVYDAGDLEHAAHVVQRRPTVVVGVGIGEWLSARAIALGALGYIHDGLDAGSVRARLVDAVARHRQRQTRSLAASALA